MGKLRNESWSRLELLIEEIGEDGVLDNYCGRIAIGDHPTDICRSFGIVPIVIRKWLEDDPKRVGMFELAKRCLADQLQWSAIQEARDSTVETVQLGKYRTDTYRVAAGVFNRKEYGTKVEIEVNQQISIIQALEEAHSRVINGRVVDQLPSEVEKEEPREMVEKQEEMVEI
jgi:hypothetical protein